MSPKADIHNQLQALISSCIDEGDYDPAEDYVKDPFCRRTLHTASLAIEEIDALRARVAEYKLAHEGSEAVIHMAIARLGGLVEGLPTHRGNFLQRIDELVAKEVGNE